MSEICLIAMNVCILYIICNFEIFLTMNLSMASKMAANMENPIYQCYFAVLSKKNITILLLFVFDITDNVTCQ